MSEQESLKDVIPSDLTGEKTDRLNIKLEQVKYLYRNATTALITNVLVAALAGLALWEWLSRETLIYWLVAIVLVVLARAYTVYRFWQIDHGDSYRPLWFYMFIAGSTINGLVWGTLVWIFSPFQGFEIPVLITFVLGGLTAGAAATLGAKLSVYFSYVLIMIAPTTLWFFMQEGNLYKTMAGMLFVYIIAMMLAGYVYRRTLLSTIILTNQLVDAREQAEAASRIKSEFLSNMSHELRTPLNAILGFTELLTMSQDHSEDSRENIEHIHMAGSHLLDLINDLLDIAKIEAGQIEFSEDEIDCSELVNECVSLIKPIADNYQVTLHLDEKRKGTPFVRGDFFRLKQVLLNLLSNACKYNQPGGRVDLYCETEGERALRISVRDSGRGIPVDRQKELFEIYNRIGFEQSVIEGTGIGLSITKQLVEQMRGSIGFKSVPGEGSTFWVDMPLVETSQQ